MILRTQIFKVTQRTDLQILCGSNNNVPTYPAFKDYVSKSNCKEITLFVEIKCQLDATDGFFIVDLIACSTYFGHHYAHHQELKSIIQVVVACGIWCFGFQVAGLV